MRHPRQPSNPAPRWLTLRFPGPCAACGKYLARGETAYYDPATKRIWGASCGHAQAGADLVATEKGNREPIVADPGEAVSNHEWQLQQEAGRERDGGFSHDDQS